MSEEPEKMTIRTALPLARWREMGSGLEDGNPTSWAAFFGIPEDAMAPMSEKPLTLEAYGRAVGQDMLEDCAQLLAQRNEIYDNWVASVRRPSLAARLAWRIRYATGSSLRWIAHKIDGIDGEY